MRSATVAAAAAATAQEGAAPTAGARGTGRAGARGAGRAGVHRRVKQASLSLRLGALEILDLAACT